MKVSMDSKPFHYDGSGYNEETVNTSSEENESFQLTEDMRRYIGSNPYTNEEK